MLDHCFSPSVLGPTRIAGCIFERNRAAINRQRDPNRLTLADQEWFTTRGCILEVMPCAPLPPPMASLPALEFPFDSAPDVGESCDRSRLAPLAYVMRVGIVGGRRRGARHRAAQLRRRRARHAGIATEIGIEPATRHAADLGIAPILIAPRRRRAPRRRGATLPATAVCLAQTA
jgi:hypothetical protein